jgi:hypothetical protein
VKVVNKDGKMVRRRVTSVKPQPAGNVKDEEGKENTDKANDEKEDTPSKKQQRKRMTSS